MLPSDVYVRSFVCLFYTLTKLYHTKPLRDQASSLNSSSLEAKNARVLHGSATTFHN